MEDQSESIAVRPLITAKPRIHMAPTVTKVTAALRGDVVICGSHGGLYSGSLAAKAGLRGIILHDAGVGKDTAGIAALAYLDDFSLAAATVSTMSCRIGDPVDMLERGVVSFANRTASLLGVLAGMDVETCANLLRKAAEPALPMQASFEESRMVQRSDGGKAIVLIDSAALVEPGDAGCIVVTGSHGGLVGRRPETALRVDALAAFFNDAGVGCESAGLGRLPVLEMRSIGAVVVAADSARIGDARSTLDDGIISFCNSVAERLGARLGMAASAFASILAFRG